MQHRVLVVSLVSFHRRKHPICVRACVGRAHRGFRGYNSFRGPPRGGANAGRPLNVTTRKFGVPQATKSSASAQTRQNQRCTVQRSSSQPQRRKTKCGSRRPNCASTKTQNTCPGGSCRRGSATGVRRHSSSGLGTPSRKARGSQRASPPSPTYSVWPPGTERPGLHAIPQD